MASLQDRLDRDVEGWRPEPGDMVLGEVISIDTRISDYNDAEYPYIEIELENGEIVGVHGFHTVLKNEIARVKPKVGDTLGIKYHGKTVAKRLDAKGKPVEFEKYRVVCEPKHAVVETPDWDSMQQDAKEESTLSGIDDSFPDEEPF